ncbi:hypothetical protein NS228_18150 [Methylobacterium indicum]|uniref:GCG_CRPN prefix-to-repeats domain-containing protein n=1 Tax=Methylobacterium indicum TaxID=1775910 RepID=UPI00073484F2|nr:hypothetical protein [Methylobacterium indicum]KTS12795.1 hypothetical protein NS229_29035 [Methylobacterium indicum]KTS38061.1 hypothetical protein NS228_18150 [Methylobacterium indicum]KTS43950.1 hypothetical protein NS230_26195 [Methylobacterium indicum]
MIRRFAIPIALVGGLLLAGSSAEARDGCGPGFHRGLYGWCRPNLVYRPYLVRPYASAPAYRRFGGHRWVGYRWRSHYRYSWHRHFAWHRRF